MNGTNMANQYKTLWTRERMIDVLKTCHSVKDFRRRYPGAYQRMKLSGWKDLKVYIPGYNEGKNHSIIWTKELLSDIISRCDSGYQFRHDYPKAYNAIQRNRWYELLKGLPKVSANESPIWCVYRWYFPDTNAVYIGLTSNYTQRIQSELRSPRTSPIYNYIVEHPGCLYTVHQLHTKLYSAEAADLEIANIASYRAEGYHVLNRNRGGSLGSYCPHKPKEPKAMKNIALLTMSNEEVIECIFRKFKTFNDLKESGNVLYKEIKKRRLRYNVEMQYARVLVTECVKKCTYLGEFQSKYPDVYKLVSRFKFGYITKMLSRKKPFYTTAELESTLERINRGEIGITTGAKSLGISHARFIQYVGDRLDPNRPRNYRKPAYEIDNVLMDKVLELVNTAQITVSSAAKTLGIPVYMFTKYSGDRLLPKSKRKIPKGKYRGGGRTNESILAEVSQNYITLSDLRSNKNLYAQVKRHGLYRQVSAMLQHAKRTSVTRDDVIVAVSNSHTYADFMRKYPSEYQTVRNNHWEDLIESLSRRYNNTSELTYKHIYECAHKCSSRTEFNKKYHTECYAAKKRGIYEQIVADIPKRSKWSK